jgi:chromate transporter
LLLGAAALVIALCGVNVLWAIAVAVVVGATWLADKHNAATSIATLDEAGLPLTRRRLGWAFVPGIAIAAAVCAAFVAGGRTGPLFTEMAKIGSVAFGNGSTILSPLRQDVVEKRHWLTAEEFGVGVGFGQMTPGPFLITSAFVGYRVAGLWGAFLAAVAIFAPSVAMTTVAAEAYPRLRRVSRVRGAIAGVMAVFVGLLAAVTIDLGRLLVDVPAAVVLAVAAFVALRRFEWNLPLLFASGLGAWAVYVIAGGPL